MNNSEGNAGMKEGDPYYETMYSMLAETLVALGDRGLKQTTPFGDIVMFRAKDHKAIMELVNHVLCVLAVKAHEGKIIIH